MFRLNRLTDYAVVVMAQMANGGGKVRTAPQIAEDTGVPSPTVAKVLNALARDGLIVSQRGAARSRRAAMRVWLRDWIEHLELYYAVRPDCGPEMQALLQANRQRWKTVFEEDIFVVEGMQLPAEIFEEIA